MLTVVVIGARGRMSQALIEGLLAQSPMVLAGICTRDPAFAASRWTLPASVKVSSDLTQLLDTAPVVIDFSTPEQTAAMLPICMAQQIPMVIGTTGLTPETTVLLQNAGNTLPIVASANMGVGMNLCFGLLQFLKTMLPKDAQLAIHETHHMHKKDSPSGTAQRLGQVLEGATDDPIQYSSFRLKDEIGVHQVSIALDGEVIQLEHRALNRSIYVTGALKAAAWLDKQPPGLYTMLDVLHKEKTV